MSEKKLQNYPVQISTTDGNVWTANTDNTTGGWDTNGDWVYTTDNSGGWYTGTNAVTTWPEMKEVLPEEIRNKKFIGYLFIDDDQNICLYDSKQKKTTKIIDLKEGEELTTLMNVIAKMLLSEQD